MDIRAYCMKTKEKNVKMKNAKIDKSGNRYIAKGDDGKGNKMSAILSKANAEAALKAKTATKGTGWKEAK